MGRKLGAARAPIFGRGSWVSTYNTMSPGPRPMPVQSGILIHSAVWSQRTWAKNWGCTPLFGADGVPI